ncbi:unnamed protein product [Rhizopus stolonifer]
MQSKRQVHLALDDNHIYLCSKFDKKQKWKIEQKISIQQLKITQISNLNTLIFSLSVINKPTLGVYSTQYTHAGQAWIHVFQSHSQKIPLFLDEDLCSSTSNNSFDYHESLNLPSTSTAVLDLNNETQMCDATQRHHPDLLQKFRPDNSRVVIGGTVTALVHELLHTYSEEYVHSFLLNYSTFTTGSNVLNEIKSFLSLYDTTLDTRVLNIFTIWCEGFALDIVGDVASGIISVLESISTVNTEKVKGIVLGTVTENAKLTACDDPKYQSTIHNSDNQEEETETSDIENILAIDGDTVNLSNILITGLVPTIFLRISPDSFAEHVYLFHLSQHIKHKQALMNPVSYLPRPQTSVEMLNSLLFTTASPHSLTKLIRNHILIDSQQYQGTEGVLLRAKLLNHWIMVGAKLYQLGDATGWCAVAMGLCSVGIVRLREAWKFVERDMVQTVQLHWARILTEHGMFEQSIWTKTWENKERLKFAQVLNLNQPQGLPFFGTIRQAVDRNRKHPKRPLGNNLINFEECQLIYRTIKQNLDAEKQSPGNTELRDIKAVGPLQSFFEYSVTDLVSVPHDLKYLQESSLACEPKIFGQVHNCSSQVPLDATNMSPFQFPVILDSCTLWDCGWTFIYSPKKMVTENVCSNVTPFLHKSGQEETKEESSSTNVDVQRSRRRTLSFPPGANHVMPSDESYGNRKEILESINSRTWLGSLASGRQHCTYPSKVLIEAHRKSRATQSSNGEFDLTVAQGGLIFKVAAVLRNEKRDKFPLKRTKSIHSVQFLNQEKEEENNQSELLVTLKGAHFEYLVECLIRGIHPYEDILKDQWQMLYLTEGPQYQTERIFMDEENFINVFFTSYRSYQSPTFLLNMFQKYFMDTKLKCKLDSKKKNSPLVLLETYFHENKTKPLNSKVDDPEEAEVNAYDWKQIASIQLRILNLVMYWVEEHPYDFIDEPEFIRYTNVFLKNSTKNLSSWCALLKSYLSKNLPKDDKQLIERKNLADALSIGDKIQQKVVKLEDMFIQNSLSPCYDMKSIRFDVECLSNAQALYQQLTRGSQTYTSTLQLATNKRPPLSLSHKPVDTDAGSLVDRYSPEVLLEQVDKDVCQLFECISIHDWAQTFDVLELQCSDPHAWLISPRSSHTAKVFNALVTIIDAPSPYPSDYRILSEEVVISDIFTAIQGAKRSVVSSSAFSDDDLLSTFPGSVQYLYCMHFIIRSWAIREMSSLEIDSKKRKMRIDKFLQIVLLSKTCSEKMALLPELKEPEANKKRAPGFVENAIASALVSPEVRLFTKAWNDIAIQYGHANLDSLEGLLSKMQRERSSALKSTSLSSFYDEPSTAVAPSLGWIFERVTEICFKVPDTIEKMDGLINFDKRRYLYHFLQQVINVQINIHKQPQKNTESKGLSMSFLISPNPSKLNWKDLKEQASVENKKGLSQGTSSGKGLRGHSSRYLGSKTVVFNKIVTKQMEKLKRDFKERDRIDKDWLVLQNKLQKKQAEQAKSEKQERPHSMMPRINSFIKGLRPPSLVISPIHHIFPANNSHDQLAAMKASTVINLIHSTTSVASTYTKRDYVFRIVTEEGGQYLFQGTSVQDMHDWMRQINDAAREGAKKRQSVLAAESLDNDSESRQSALLIETSSRNPSPSYRKSIYGVHLDNLMRDGKIPLIVEKCIKEIEKRGLEEIGIYRVAGTGSIVSMLKAEFNKDVQKVDLESSKWADINVVADSLKQFLRELPEPLLTYAYYDEFINASASEDHDQRVYLIKEVIKKLPYNNYILLKKIIEHFVNVTDFEGINHMYATNLAIVFGPTLLQPASGPASFATTMSNLGHHQNIVKYLILNYHYLFDVESEEIETKDEQALVVE